MSVQPGCRLRSRSRSCRCRGSPRCRGPRSPSAKRDRDDHRHHLRRHPGRERNQEQTRSRQRTMQDDAPAQDEGCQLQITHMIISPKWRMQAPERRFPVAAGPAVWRCSRRRWSLPVRTLAAVPFPVERQSQKWCCCWHPQYCVGPFGRSAANLSTGSDSPASATGRQFVFVPQTRGGGSDLPPNIRCRMSALKLDREVHGHAEQDNCDDDRTADRVTQHNRDGHWPPGQPEKWIGKKTQEADQSSEARFAGRSDLQQLPDWVQILHICGGRTLVRSGRLTPESRRFSTRPIGPALALIHREDEGAGRCFGRFV